MQIFLANIKVKYQARCALSLTNEKSIFRGTEKKRRKRSKIGEMKRTESDDASPSSLHSNNAIWRERVFGLFGFLKHRPHTHKRPSLCPCYILRIHQHRILLLFAINTNEKRLTHQKQKESVVRHQVSYLFVASLLNNNNQK